MIELERLAGLGLTQSQIADWFGFHEKTLERRLKTPEAMSVYKRGRARAIDTVTTKLWQHIEEGDKASLFFWLKCQARWREADKGDSDAPNVEEFSEASRAVMAAMAATGTSRDADD